MLKIKLYFVFIIYSLIPFILSNSDEETQYINQYYAPDEQTSTFAEEWEKRMADYEQDFIHMIPLKHAFKEIYYENITQVPARIRGAFIADEEQRHRINFEVNIQIIRV